MSRISRFALLPDSCFNLSLMEFEIPFNLVIFIIDNLIIFLSYVLSFIYQALLHHDVTIMITRKLIVCMWCNVPWRNNWGGYKLDVFIFFYNCNTWNKKNKQNEVDDIQWKEWIQRSFLVLILNLTFQIFSY